MTRTNRHRWLTAKLLTIGLAVLLFGAYAHYRSDSDPHPALRSPSSIEPTAEVATIDSNRVPVADHAMDSEVGREMPENATLRSGIGAALARQPEEMDYHWIATNFDAILDLAISGNIDAVRTIAHAIAGCGGPIAGIDLPQLEAAAAHDPSSVVIRDALAAENNRTLRCSHFRQEQIALEREVLRLAANAGEDWAAIAYMRAPPELDQRRQKSIEEHRSWQTEAEVQALAAAARGSREAMRELGRAYQLGAFGREDPVLAYQYAYAAAIVRQSDVAPPAPYVLALEARALARLQAQLTPAQVQAADERATELVRRCCQ